MHLSMSSRRWKLGGGGGGGGEGGFLGRGFDIFQKIAVKLPAPRQKGEVKFNWNSHPGIWFVVEGMKKSQISLLPGQQDNLNALTQGQSDQSNPCPMPRQPPPCQLDIDRCTWACSHGSDPRYTISFFPWSSSQVACGTPPRWVTRSPGPGKPLQWGGVKAVEWGNLLNRDNQITQVWRVILTTSPPKCQNTDEIGSSSDNLSMQSESLANRRNQTEVLPATMTLKWKAASLEQTKKASVLSPAIHCKKKDGGCTFYHCGNTLRTKLSPLGI